MVKERKNIREMIGKKENGRQESGKEDKHRKQEGKIKAMVPENIERSYHNNL